MPERERWAAVICAAGSSSRFAAGGPKKEYRILPGAEMNGRPLTVLGACAAAFAAIPHIDVIVITIPPGAEAEAEARRALPKMPGTVIFVPGGASRQESVRHALNYLAGYEPDYVLIHDGARPWVSAALITRVMDAVREHGAALPVTPLTETPKLVEKVPGTVKAHLRRADVAAAQTPQGFRFAEYLAAMEKADPGTEYTDDAEIWGAFCGPAEAVPGDAANKKITFAGDL